MSKEKRIRNLEREIKHLDYKVANMGHITKRLEKAYYDLYGLIEYLELEIVPASRMIRKVKKEEKAI